MSRVVYDEQAIEVSEDSIKAWAKFSANGIDSIESSKVFIEKLISPMLNELEKRLLKDIQ